MLIEVDICCTKCISMCLENVPRGERASGARSMPHLNLPYLVEKQSFIKKVFNILWIFIFYFSKNKSKFPQNSKFF